MPNQNSKPSHIFSVSEINLLIKSFIESEALLQQIWITGEISNLKFYQLGKQVYFNLVDADSQMNCVIFGYPLKNTFCELKNGQKVFALGRLSYYHKRGQLSFQIFYISETGLGPQAQALQKLKEKLAAEGLFDPSRKKAIPKYPHELGLITAYNSAAMWDFITCAQKWMPAVHITVIPAIMQGAKALESLIEALHTTSHYAPLDAIVILRGGGSAEDLQVFNSEHLVRAAAQHPKPIISAIGHEIDYTLLDFVADLRAPTPTAAAEYLSQHYRTLFPAIIQRLSQIKTLINEHYNDKQNQLTETRDLISQTVTTLFQARHDHFQHIIQRLTQANPLHKLKQGYSISRLKKTGEIIKSIQSIKIGSRIQTDFIDGYLISDVVTRSKSTADKGITTV